MDEDIAQALSNYPQAKVTQLCQYRFRPSSLNSFLDSWPCRASPHAQCFLGSSEPSMIVQAAGPQKSIVHSTWQDTGRNGVCCWAIYT